MKKHIESYRKALINAPLSLVDIYRRSIDGLTPKVWMLALITLVNRSGSMIFPFLNVYLKDGLDFSMHSIAIVAFCYGVGSMIGAFLGGILVDKYGSYKVASFSLIGSFVVFLVFLVSTDFYFLCVWSIVAITVADLFRPAVMVNIGEHSDDKTLTRGISLIRMAMNLGVAVGPLAAGILITYFGYHWIFIVDALTCLGAGLIYVKYFHQGAITPIKSEKKPSIITAILDLPFLFFMIFNLINLIAFFQIIESIPLYITDELGYSPLVVSLFLFANGFMIFLLELPLIHYIEQRYRAIDCVIVGIVLIALGYLCLFLFDNFIIAISLYSIFVAVGEIINFPFITTIAHKRSDESNRGSYMGTTALLFSIALLISPFCLNFIEAFSYHWAWLLMFGVSLLGALGIWILKRELDKKANASS